MLATAGVLVAAGVRPDEIEQRYEAIRAEIADEAESLKGTARLSSAAEVMAPLAPRSPDRVAELTARFDKLSADSMTLAESINATLDQILTADRRVIVFGEDVGVKGGVYGLTGGLARRHGAARVFDTVLDEQSILGLGLGAGLAGLVPIPEIQYLAYLHNAEDQLRGEAATLPFFSLGRFTNPMVVRVAGLGYQKGFGGHFHNDNALGVLRDIPGLVVACPARADDAAALLRSCVAAAIADGTLSVFLEPIALYHRRDLYADGDRRWLADDHGDHAPVGRARVYPCPSTGSGHLDDHVRQRGAHEPAGRGTAGRPGHRGGGGRPAVAGAAAGGRHPGRGAAYRPGAGGRRDQTTAGVGEGVVCALVEDGFGGPILRVASEDSFIPLGPAARHVLLSETDIEKSAITLAGMGSS